MSHHYLQAGDQAPEFILKNQAEKEVTPITMEGKKLLLSFHPLAWTSVCEIQMRTLEVKHTKLKELDVIAYGISVDSPRCKKAWAESMGIEHTNLLADFWPHGEVAAQYGLFLDDMGVSTRANVLIGLDRTIEWVKVYEILQVPDIEEIVSFLENSEE